MLYGIIEHNHSSPLGEYLTCCLVVHSQPPTIATSLLYHLAGCNHSQSMQRVYCMDWIDTANPNLCKKECSMPWLGLVIPNLSEWTFKTVSINNYIDHKNPFNVIWFVKKKVQKLFTRSSQHRTWSTTLVEVSPRHLMFSLVFCFWHLFAAEVNLLWPEYSTSGPPAPPP